MMNTIYHQQEEKKKKHRKEYTYEHYYHISICNLWTYGRVYFII